MPAAGLSIPEIRVLPPLVANQIAAGEVVERPASVVKELIDNALDAGAGSVAVELEQGGVELVRVTDDGHGVPPAQLPLMLAAHATSKVRTADDLDRVTTMGFRGEALASIASVARVGIRSRTAADVAAHRLDAEGVTLGEVRPESGPVGTSVSVRNLFFNTPARRKFLKTPGTELGHCTDLVRDLAMAHPHVGFVLRVDGRVTLELPGEQSPRERVLALLGREMESQFVEASADRFDDARGVALWGLVGLPVLARPTARNQHVFINGRPVRDKTIQHALREAYRGLIEPGRHPSAVLQLVMDPGAVDVNVHPAKAEVRFRDSSMVHQAVYRAVREALRGADLTPGASGAHPGLTPGGPSGDLYIGGVGGGDQAGPVRVTPIGSAWEATGTQGRAPGVRGQAARFVEYFQRPAAPVGGSRFEYEPLRSAVRELDAAPPQSEPAPPAATEAQNDAAVPPDMAVPLPTERVLQVHNSYLVTQDEHGVVIIDQHALHERVMFERLTARVLTGPLESQQLLVPVVVGAPPAAVDRLAEFEPVFTRLGLVVEPLGAASVGVRAFPSFLLEKRVDPGEFVGEMLEKAAAEPSSAGVAAGTAGALREEELLHEVLDMMACKAAIKAGNSLSDEELGELLRLRSAVERSSNCPHGRPTAIRLSIKDLERSFGRS